MAQGKTTQSPIPPAQAVRELLMNGMGGAPFLGLCAKPSGQWVHGCLHTAQGYTYMPRRMSVVKARRS